MSTANRYQHIKSTKPILGKTRKLKDLMIKSDNWIICANCGAPDPKWASANIGLFLSLKCGDVHRALGPYISKVLSVTLDDWSDSDIDSMVEVGGSSYVNSIYEAFLPKDHPKPKPDSTMEYMTKFIRSLVPGRVRADNGVNSAYVLGYSGSLMVPRGRRFHVRQCSSRSPPSSRRQTAYQIQRPCRPCRKMYALTWALQYVNLSMINTGYIILAGQALKTRLIACQLAACHLVHSACFLAAS